MAITQTDYDDLYAPDGALLSRQERVRDVTDQVVTLDIYAKARAYLESAQTFLDNPSPTQAQTLAQVRRNTRAIAGLIRLLPDASDLLVENTDT
jgi:hypothetical protein